MHIEEQSAPGVLRLRVTDKTLVKRPDWDDVMARLGPDTLLVILDLQGVEFISSLFFEGCVGLGSGLAHDGGELVLTGLSTQEERVLEYVQGASRLKVVGDECQLSAYAASASARTPERPLREGVTRSEKYMLWG